MGGRRGRHPVLEDVGEEEVEGVGGEGVVPLRPAEQQHVPQDRRNRGPAGNKRGVPGSAGAFLTPPNPNWRRHPTLGPR